MRAGVRVALWMPLRGLTLAVGLSTAQAQPQAPSADDPADAAQPVRVVCVADNPAALPVGADGRVHAFMLGGRYVTPLGSGFVVDPDRRHVLGSWLAVTQCSSGHGGPPRQLGVLEAGDSEPVLAAVLPDRTFQDGQGRPVPLVQALCRDSAQPCGAELPLGPGARPLAEAERQRQRANVLAYAPDLALLRLPRALRSAPLALALTQQLDDQMRLVIRGHAPALAGGEAGPAALAALVAPLSIGAVYTGPEQFSQRQGEVDVHARLHRLAASVAPGQSGAAVLRLGGVVGVLSAAQDLPGPNGTAAAGPGVVHAVPATVVAGFLNLLGVPYLRVADEAPAAPLPAAAPTGTGWGQRQRLMLAGAALLALLAGLAFVLLARRTRRAAAEASAEASANPAAHTASGTAGPSARSASSVAAGAARSSAPHTRGNPTLLHAMALPTEVPTQAPPGLAAAGPATVARVLGEAPAAVHLRVLQGPLAAAVFSLPMPRGGGTAFAGRDAQACQIVFPPALDSVSAVHACFSWDAAQQRLSLRDLSSSGTWLNGDRVEKARTLLLQHGDEVDLGGPGLNRVQIDIPGAPLPATEARP